MKRAVHIVVRDNKWIVKMAGSTKAYRVCATRQEALDIGAKMAINQRTDRILHRPDGSIHWVDNYKYPPIGTEHPFKQGDC